MSDPKPLRTSPRLGAAPVAFACMVALLGASGCRVQKQPPQDPCNPNPCTEANKTRCANEEGNALCLCDEGFVTRPNGSCEQANALNCPAHAGDQAEPDDCVARARTFEPGSDQRTQTIDPVGDYDFVSFTGTGGHVIAATAKPTAGPLAPRLDLFDQAGRLVAYAENVGDVRLAAKLPASGTYALRVMHSPLDPSVATGTYTLALQSLGAEDHGDGPETATLIAPDVATQQPTTRFGKFEFPADQDWFEFSATTSQNYRLTFNANRVVPVVSLWVPGNTDAPYWTVQQDVVDFDVPSDGTAYLSVYPPDASGGSYEFTLVRAPK